MSNRSRRAWTGTAISGLTSPVLAFPATLELAGDDEGAEGLARVFSVTMPRR
jgi:hypothetical protein